MDFTAYGPADLLPFIAVGFVAHMIGVALGTYVLTTVDAALA